MKQKDTQNAGMFIGDTLLKLRKEQGLTQEKLSQLLNVTRQTVQKWESGSSNPGLEHIVLLSKLFNVSSDSLLLGADKRSEEVNATVGKKIRPDYMNLKLWEPYSKHIMTEYRQCMDEGKDIAQYEDLFLAVSKMPLSSEKEKICDVLYQLTTKAPQRKDYPYYEPNDYDAILAERPTAKVKIRSYKDTKNRYREKLMGAWLGRVCGCLLGKPIECIRTEEFDKLLEYSDNKPLHRYILSTDINQDFYNTFKFNLKNRPWADKIQCMPWDDDTNYTVLAWKLIETYGRNFQPLDVAQLWLDNQPRSAYWTAERVAFGNFINGYYPPESAQYKNPYREWIGAQIRGDYFGYINPGNPEEAARMAYQDAVISHVKNGIYGEMFVSAMIASSAVETDIEKIILSGLDQIPARSRLAEKILWVLDQFHKGTTQKQLFSLIHEEFDEHVTYDWCHTITNAMVVTASLLYGFGDYEKSICMAVETGYDTDCNGATVGSILGMRSGVICIGDKWSKPVRGLIETTIFGVNTVSVEEMVLRTEKHVEF